MSGKHNRSGRTTPFSPYNDASVGSFYFNGTTDYISVPASTDFNFDGDFTIETWIFKQNASGTNYPGLFYRSANWRFKFQASDTIFYYDNTTDAELLNTTAFDLNCWQHIAIVRSGTTLKGYLNGYGGASITETGNFTSSDPLLIGTNTPTNSGTKIQGYMSDIRIVKGHAVYTSDFTPPTTALTNISGTGYSTVLLAQPNGKNINTDTSAPEDRKEFAAIAAGLGQEPQTVLNEGTQITSSGADTATYSYQSAMVVPALPEGKWYFEVRDLFYYLDIGLMSGRFDEGVGNSNYIASSDRGTSLRFAPYSGKLRLTPTGGTSNDDYQTLGIGATGTAPGTGDIYGIDFDTITNTFGVSKNGGTRYTYVVPTSDFVMSGKNIGMSDGTSSNQGNLQLNFGQNPTFNGNITPSGGTNSDGSYPDADGIGGFRYAPPTGYKALRFTGTTRPSGLNKPALNPDKYFDMVRWVGIEQAKRIRGLKFKPGLVWMKAIDYEQNWLMFDSVRGPGRNINSDVANAEEDNTNALSAFEDDGFSLGTSGEVQYPDKNYIAYCWKAGDDQYVNTDGTITSTVSANVDAGFSIVNYVGTGSAGTIGHGLSRAPELMWVKPLSTANSWVHYDSQFGGTHYMALQETQASGANSTRWNDLNPDSKVFSVGNHVSVSDSNNRHIAYLWHSVEGYSKIGTFEGNSNNDGPFIYLGFRPAFVLTKCGDSQADSNNYNDWCIEDDVRNTHNPHRLDTTIRPNSNRIAGARYGGSGNNANRLELLSNGFKVRSTEYETNQTLTIIYMAFARRPSAFTTNI